MINNSKYKINNIIRDKHFAFKSLVFGFISIILMIIFGTIISIYQGEPFENVEGCVENSFLAFILFFIIIKYKTGNEEFLESLMGELLAIYLVTNTTYFVEKLIEVLTTQNETLDYIYLLMEFLIMISSIAVFIDHLEKSHDLKVEKTNKTIIYILLVLILIALTFDLIAIVIYNEEKYTLLFIDEIFYIIFGSSLTLAVLSKETIRIEGAIE